MTTGPLHWELLQRSRFVVSNHGFPLIVTVNRAVDNQVFFSMCSPARDLSAGYHAVSATAFGFMMHHWNYYLVGPFHGCWSHVGIYFLSISALYTHKDTGERFSMKHRMEKRSSMRILVGTSIFFRWPMLSSAQTQRFSMKRVLEFQWLLSEGLMYMPTSVSNRAMYFFLLNPKTLD